MIHGAVNRPDSEVAPAQPAVVHGTRLQESGPAFFPLNLVRYRPAYRDENLTARQRVLSPETVSYVAPCPSCNGLTDWRVERVETRIRVRFGQRRNLFYPTGDVQLY